MIRYIAIATALLVTPAAAEESDLFCAFDTGKGELVYRLERMGQHIYREVAMKRGKTTITHDRADQPFWAARPAGKTYVITYQKDTRFEIVMRDRLETDDNFKSGPAFLRKGDTILATGGCGFFFDR